MEKKDSEASSRRNKEPPSPQEKPLMKRIQCGESDEDDEEDEEDDDLELASTSRLSGLSLEDAKEDPMSKVSEEERDHIRSCHLSGRRLEDDDVLRVGRKISSGWREVGNSLHFTHAQLDAIEAEAKDDEPASEVMLCKWIKWKSERATVKRLSKALYNNGLIEAIKVLEP